MGPCCWLRRRCEWTEGHERDCERFELWQVSGGRRKRRGMLTMRNASILLSSEAIVIRLLSVMMNQRMKG